MNREPEAEPQRVSHEEQPHPSGRHRCPATWEDTEDPLEDDLVEADRSGKRHDEARMVLGLGVEVVPPERDPPEPDTEKELRDGLTESVRRQLFPRFAERGGHGLRFGWSNLGQGLSVAYDA